MDGQCEGSLPPQAILTCLAGHLAQVPSLIALGRSMATQVETILVDIRKKYKTPAGSVLNMAALEPQEAPAARLYNTEPQYPPAQRISTCKVAARLNGIPVEAVVDTGASTTAVTLDCLRRLDLDSLVHPTRANYLNADGRVSKGKGKVPNLILGLGELETLTSPTVTTALNYDLLIGNDILKRIKAVIDYDKSTLTLRVDPHHNQELPISTTHQVETQYYKEEISPTGPGNTI